MQKGTLNHMNGGPKAGKTTLTAQAVAAHFRKEPFWVKGLNFPEGGIAWVQTDRPSIMSKPLFEALGIWQHPELQLINFLDDRALHNLTRPSSRKEREHLELLWTAILDRISLNAGTIILDLYNEFITSDSKSGSKNAYYGRQLALNAQAADVAILGLVYPFKQTTSNSACRAQDRISGSLYMQASGSWAHTIVDPEENGAEFGTIEAKPGVGEGSEPVSYPYVRGTEKEGDMNGLLRPYDSKELKDEPWNKLGISRATYFRRKRRDELDDLE